MSNFAAKLKHETAEAIPPAIFFFATFQIIAVTRALMVNESGVELSTFVSATVAALIVAKVVLIVDLFPFVNRFPEKPLAYNVVWKTLIYMVAALLVRVIEHLIPFIREQGNLGAAFASLLDEVVWQHFWAVQILLLALFLAYCAMRELGRVIGRDRVLRMFFGPVEAVAV